MKGDEYKRGFGWGNLVQLRTERLLELVVCTLELGHLLLSVASQSHFGRNEDCLLTSLESRSSRQFPDFHKRSTGWNWH